MSATQIWLGVLGVVVVAVGGADAVAALLATAEARVLHQGGQGGGDHADGPGRGAPPRCADGRRSGDFAGEWPRPPWPAPHLPAPAVRVPTAAAPKRSSRWGTPGDWRRAARWHGRSSSPEPGPNARGRFGENTQRFFRISRCSRRWRCSRRAASSWDCRSVAAPVLDPAAAPLPLN